ncbi:tetratricopeptide repeat protein [Stygiolobus caldivivus]|uniref:Protein kinase domain-containing protein n=1 Tax=Stygiolobus caldivivus TaxID=2824673 RepID=A0A8D5U6Q6_9CREN|nr:tetratricopeptide repeat protein [Stygiolobus caldivivus]BCU70323.1 hypothetical protein KN1_16200 [Stygiolobus caldivivus]
MSLWYNIKDSDVYLHKGITYYSQGLYDDALGMFEMALKVDPANVEAHNYKGLSLIGLSRYDEAQREFEDVLKLDPQNLVAHLGLGVVLLNKGKYEEALKEFNKVSRKNPNSVEVHNLKGQAYYKMGKYESAIRQYNEALKLDPKNAAIHYNKGLVYFAMGNYRKAIEEFDIAVTLEPTLFEAIRKLEEAKLKLSQQPPKTRQHRAVKNTQDIDYSKWIGRKIYGYKIENILGEGGFGIVFLVSYSGKYYAMKVRKISYSQGISNSLTKIALDVFQDLQTESANLISLSKKSPHLVEIYAIYIDSNKLRNAIEGNMREYTQSPPAIIMEYMEGGDIRSIVNDRIVYSSLWYKVVASIGYQIASALEVVHKEGYVHLDVKPENFFLSKKVNVNTAQDLLSYFSGGSLTVKLGDLGAAKRIGQRVTEISPLYAPPEQFNPNSIADPKMDIFALGASLYSLYKGVSGFNPPEISNSTYPDVVSKYYAYFNNLVNDCNMRGQNCNTLERVLLWLVHPDPRQRPSMTTVKEWLSRV